MDFQYYMNTYGYTTLGILLIACNLPVLVVVSYSRNMRTQYGVLIISLFNGFLSGIGTIGFGIFQFVVYGTEQNRVSVTVLQCLYNPITVFLLWVFPMSGLGLLLMSIDRFLVIRYPLSYFHYNAKAVLLLNAVALAVNFGIVFGVTYDTLSSPLSKSLINITCNQKEVLSQQMYIAMAVVRIAFAFLAIVVMLYVLVLFVRHSRTKTKQAFGDETLKRFKNRQMNFTKTMLISCAVTVVVFILPSIYSIIGSLLGMRGIITVWVRFVNFFNSFNIPILVLYRQRDIRCKLAKIANCMLMRDVISTPVTEHSNAHGANVAHIQLSERGRSRLENTNS
ncbi:hypothetical protein QR680_015594 [Steinernema hermaphroditum]|uniref:G-protein coupled receptors family 1 profile domain-containing protein n=1 Tax=Steinernema hermaphroditum TaxID=289476 RepID=A0AA39LL12_9BILA|nr:hypothetical protein QR680_015594 [Steinernema hermaphroditum]